MRNYNVIMLQTAHDDLDDITTHLKKYSLETANKYFHLILEKMLSLTTFPMARPFVRDIRLRELGIRWTYANNYTIFFKVNDERGLVFIERILYSRMEYDTII